LESGIINSFGSKLNQRI